MLLNHFLVFVGEELLSRFELFLGLGVSDVGADRVLERLDNFIAVT